MRTLLLLLACAGGPGDPAPAAPGLRLTLAEKRVDEGEPVVLTVEARTAAGWSVQLPPPVATGLELQPGASAGPLPEGAQELRTWTWELHGPPGSYVIEPMAGQATGPDGATLPLTSERLFVDIGVDGPLATGLSEFEAAPPVEGPPWALILGVSALALATALGLGLAWRARQRPPPPPEPDPPHVAARKAWVQARAQGLDDHPLALRLSAILREYLEAITGWPATMRTGAEILDWLEAERIAGPTARLHASHILSATDRLKFAREGGGPAFFAALDQDFDVVIEATCPAPSRPPPAGEETRPAPSRPPTSSASEEAP